MRSFLVQPLVQLYYWIICKVPLRGMSKLGSRFYLLILLEPDSILKEPRYAPHDRYYYERDEKLQPPFMHTALKIALKLKNRLIAVKPPKFRAIKRPRPLWGNQITKDRNSIPLIQIALTVSNRETHFENQ